MEPVSRVYEWVWASLRSQATTFELVGPARQTVPREGVRVREAGLAPSTLLNFR